MPDLSVKLSVQIPGGPTVQSERQIAIATHQQLDLTLPPNTEGNAQIDVDFLTDASKEEINLLLIQSSLYSPDLTYTIEGTKIENKKLVEPLVLLGRELIKAIANPKKITFKNKYQWTDGKDETLTKNTAKITILIGRAVTPKATTTTGTAG